MQLNQPKQGLRVLGHAPSLDIMRNYRACLTPLRFGAGLKGKVLDSWAHGEAKQRAIGLLTNARAASLRAATIGRISPRALTSAPHFPQDCQCAPHPLVQRACLRKDIHLEVRLLFVIVQVHAYMLHIWRPGRDAAISVPLPRSDVCMF